MGGIVADMPNGHYAGKRSSVSGSTYWVDIVRLKDSIPEHQIVDIINNIETSLRSSDFYSHGFGALYLHEFMDLIPKGAHEKLCEGFAFALVWANCFEAFELLEGNVHRSSLEWYLGLLDTIIDATDQATSDYEVKLRALKAMLRRPNLPNRIETR